MFRYSQKIASLGFILICLNMGACASTTTQQQYSAPPPPKLVQPVTDQSRRVIGKIDWVEGRVYSYGSGHLRTPAPYTVTHGRDYALADAQQSMLEVIRNLQVDANNKASTFFHYAVISRYINERVKQREILEREQYSENNHQVTVSLPLLGNNGITKLLIPTVLENESQKSEPTGSAEWEQYDQSDIWPDNYSSLIIDARGLDYRPALFAAIVDENGHSLYSLNKVDPNAAMFMLCEYTDSMNAALRSSRAGPTPLILQALAPDHDPLINVVLAKTEAQRLIAADARGRFLHDARVIVVIND